MRNLPAPPPRRSNSYQPKAYPKSRGSFRPQASEESHGQMPGNRQRQGAVSRKRGSYQQQRAEIYPKRGGETSDVSSFHTAPRAATISTGFRASKRRLFEITQEPAHLRDRPEWDQQWVVPTRSQGGAGGSKDPFEINKHMFGFAGQNK